MPISSPERIRLGGNEDFLAHPPPFGAMASSSANPVASASPHGRWDARDAENVATNRAACNQRGRPRDQLVPWTPQGGSSVLQRPSISRVQAPASETSARQSSEYGLLLRPPFRSAGMAVERAARWATSASTIYAGAWQAPKAWPCGFYGRSIKNRRRPPVGKAMANRYLQRGNGSTRSRISRRFGCQTVGLRWD